MPNCTFFSFDRKLLLLVRSASRALIEYESIHTCTDEQSISQPRLEEAIFRRFVDVHVTAEQQFYITWIYQEDDQLRSDPDFDDLIEVLSFLDYVAEDGWKEDSQELDECVSNLDRR